MELENHPFDRSINDGDGLRSNAGYSDVRSVPYSIDVMREKTNCYVATHNTLLSEMSQLKIQQIPFP